MAGVSAVQSRVIALGGTTISRCGTMFERSRERTEHGRGEQIAHAGVQPDAAHTLDERHGKQRVAAEGEEVVVPADAFEAEQFGPQIGECDFGRTLRRFEGTQREGVGLRIGQRAAIELAVGRERQRIEHDEGRRHHVVGQARGEVFAQGADIDIGGQRDIGDELLILRLLMPRTSDDHRFAHRRMIGQMRFDLAEFDTEAANLDLMIVAAEELDIAVGAIACEVARAVHACAGHEGIVEEALGSEFGPIQIAARHACAADIKLAHRAERHRPALRIEQIICVLAIGLPIVSVKRSPLCICIQVEYVSRLRSDRTDCTGRSIPDARRRFASSARASAARRRGSIVRTDASDAPAHPAAT